MTDIRELLLSRMEAAIKAEAEGQAETAYAELSRGVRAAVSRALPRCSVAAREVNALLESLRPHVEARAIEDAIYKAATAFLN